MAVLGNMVVLGFGDVGISMSINPKLHSGNLIFRNLDNPTTGPDQKLSEDDFSADDKTRVGIVYDHATAKLLRDSFAKMVDAFEFLEEKERLQTETS